MTRLARGEFHAFEAAGRHFVYLVPSAAVFALDDTARLVLQALDGRRLTPPEIAAELDGRCGRADVEETIAELRRVGALSSPDAGGQPGARFLPEVPFPLTTMVLNVTNQCNLSCAYCYEYGEDRIVEANGTAPRFMTEDTARNSVEFMFREAGPNKVAHLTFFGGETLLNFKVLKSTVAYAKRRAAELDKTVDFSLTTNATLLRPDVIEFLAENQVGVTISIDGPREIQDRFRVFQNGEGSYDVVLPKIRELLRQHRTRPIGARVTLTSHMLDVKRIFRHLTEDVGFWEVGFAPVTTARSREHAIDGPGFARLLAEFHDLAGEFLDAAVANRHHGFSNVKETLAEIHKGFSKAFPCGAGLGLMGVATNGDVALCHRFAGSDAHTLGTVATGVDRTRQVEFLERHHIDEKIDCRACWARPLCSGGCYHEAHTRYGTTTAPNLHYCEWIRAWTHTCLEIYGALWTRSPQFFGQFERQAHEAS